MEGMGKRQESSPGLTQKAPRQGPMISEHKLVMNQLVTGTYRKIKAGQVQANLSFLSLYLEK
jgi:hypothetical protein